MPVFGANAATSPPSILKTQVSGETISVPLALSYQQIVLERRVGAGWKPVAVQYPRLLRRAQMRHIFFTLPSGLKANEVRVCGYRQAKFPSRFINGKRQFSRPLKGDSSPVSMGFDRLIKASPTEVFPSDHPYKGLWEIKNQQLFFLNQYRGLQIVDLTDPQHPFRSGILRIPAFIEQMYLLNETGTEVALLGRNNGKDYPGAAVLFLVRVKEGIPELAGQLRLDGLYAGGLVIGSRLYGLTNSTDGGYGAKAILTTVDLSVLESPKILNQTSFIGKKSKLRIQDSKLLVSVTVGDTKRLHDIKLDQGLDLLKKPATSPESNKILDCEVRITQQRLSVTASPNLSTASEMTLAWRADRVLPVGEYLVQVDDGMDPDLSGKNQDGSERNSRLRLSSADDPDLLLEELDLGPGDVVGLSLQGEALFVAQWVNACLGHQAFLRTWVLDLSDPTTMVVQKKLDQDLEDLDEWDLDLDRVQPLWVNERLHWYIPALHQSNHWLGSSMRIFPLKSQEKTLVAEKSVLMALCPIHWKGSAATAEKPQILRTRGTVTHTSSALLTGELMYFSHDNVEARTTSAGDKTQHPVPLRPQPETIKSWMQVVDFRGDKPLLRDPVPLPGQLLGLSQADDQGAVVLTHSDLALRRGTAPSRVVQATAYDGVNTYLLDDYVTATPFGSAIITDGAHFYATRELGKENVVAVGYDATSGRISQTATWQTNAPPRLLKVVSGHLLASSPGNLEVASLKEDGTLQSLASYDTPINLTMPVDRAAVTSKLDLWIPAGEYGVEFLQKQNLRP